MPINVFDREREHHEHKDPHQRSFWLSDVLLGGQDGLVNVLGVILGVAAATHQSRIVLVAGFAAALAESVSMAAVAYTSKIAEGEVYQSERAREYRHIEQVPHLEREEIREMYAKKGFHGELLDRIVETITSNKDVWVAVMMAEEHGLVEVNRVASLTSALIVGVSALIGSLIPLIPFLLVSVSTGIWSSIVIAAITLFSFGIYKAKRTTGHVLKSGIELTLIGIVSALLGYGVGAIFKIG